MTTKNVQPDQYGAAGASGGFGEVLVALADLTGRWLRWF